MSGLLPKDQRLTTEASDLPHHYRHDIDGLRGLAVVIVLIFHVVPGRLTGGFVGVDIFFVISGYLITKVILRDLAKKRFSIRRFYERRIRRILPALLAMISICSVGCYCLFVPYDLIQYSKSIFAALLFYSNLFFSDQSGYFDVTYVKVLLHTWSLAVEEQFYLLVPPILIFLIRHTRLLRPVIVVFASVSFSISIWLCFSNPEKAFFMPWSRAWEIMAGAFLALGSVRVPSSRNARNVLATSGLLMIILAAFFYAPTTPFPGVAALLPCFGSLILILTGENKGSAVSVVLSAPLAAFIGRISYSVYLWHWPLILLVRLGAVDGINNRGPLNNGVIILASIGVGYLSWMLFEQPFRVGGWNSGKPVNVFGLAASSICVLMAVALFVIFTGGLPGRFPPRSIQIVDYARARIHQNMRVGSCFLINTNRFSDYKADQCAVLDRSGKRNYLLIGDSHAAAFWFALQTALPGANVMQATASTCKPTLGNYDSSNCGQMRHFIFETYLGRHELDGVILTEQWSKKKDIEDVETAIALLTAHRIPVFIIGPVPEYNAPLPMLLAFAIKRKDIGLPAGHLMPGLNELDKALGAKSSGWNATYLSPWQAICGNRHCEEYVDDDGTVPILVDDNHLSNSGALKLAREWTAGGLLK